MERDYEYLSKAELLIKHRRFDLAEQHLKDSIAHGLANEETHSLLSACFLQKQDFKSAHREATIGLNMNPGNAFCFYSKSLIHFNEGNYSKCINTILEAIELASSNTEYLFILANAHFYKNNLEKTSSILDSILNLDPLHVEALNLKSKYLIAIGKYQEAKLILEEATIHDPLAAISFCNLGWCLLHLGDPLSAKQYFFEALMLDPQLEEAQEGILSSLRHQIPIYRSIKKCSNFLMKLPNSIKWALMMSIVWTVFFLPILAAPYLITVFYSWFGKTIFNTLLRTKQTARLAFTQSDIFRSNLLIGTVLTLVFCSTFYGLTGSLFYFTFGLVVFSLQFPIVGTLYFLNSPSELPYKKVVQFFLGIGVATIFSAILPRPALIITSSIYTLSIILFTWYFSYACSRYS